MYESNGCYNDICLYGVNSCINMTNTDNSNITSNNDIINSLYKGAFIHKEIRKYLQSYLKPNIKLYDIVNIIETKTIELSKFNNTINKGIGFPVSLSLNNCAAHFHPEFNDDIKMTYNDILKIDYGIEINGWIIDSAFSIAFDYKYNNLLKAVKEATNTGLNHIGIDANINDYSTAIEEVMCSFEIELNNEILPIKPIYNLGGHNIIKEIIHGGVFLPCIKNITAHDAKFTEGVYAVETFGTTNSNIANNVGVANLYMLNKNYKVNYINLLPTQINEKILCDYIITNFKTIPFTNRYLNSSNILNFEIYLNNLINYNIIKKFPPLCIDKGYTAQYEHTVYIGENKKIIFSQDIDY